MRRWIQRKAARAQARDPEGAMDTATRGPSAELPHRSEMERAFNQSFADVKVHTGQKEPMAQLGAHAATEGRTVAFADSQPDKKLVAHELTHVVQNREGARSTGVSQPGQEPEREADSNAERVAAGGRAQVQAAPVSGISRLGESEGELRERLLALEAMLQSVLSGDDFGGMEKLVDQLFELKQLAHENNFGALANEICGKMPQWTSALEGVPAEKWPSEERQACERKLGAVAAAKKTFNTLGNDKWREFIDGKDHDYGADCYDKGSNKGGADAGWLASEQLADRHVGAHIGEHLDVAGYAQIHDMALQHSQKRHGFRGASDDIGVPTRAAKRDMSAVAEMGPEPTVDIGGQADKDGIYRANHTPMPRPEVQARVQEALDEYYFNIGRAQSKNDKLRVITQVHQKLERLHAFIDGTGRTDHFVLNKFLVENGFAPVILHDQNEVNHSTAATWQAAIEKGMSDWLMFANQQVHEQDREQYDAEIDKALLLQNLVGAPDVHSGRALPQVNADASEREDWRKSHTKVVSSPKAEEEKKTVEERKQPEEEKKDNPLLALKHGKSELAQKVIDLAIKFGFTSAEDVLLNSWWGDFKEAGVTADKWDAIKDELGT